MAQSTNFGASIVPSHTNTTHLDSPVLTPAVSTEDLQEPYNTNKPITSPFYQHPPASFEKVQHSRNNSRTAPLHEKNGDLEAATPLRNGSSRDADEHPFASKISVDCSKECKMWPSKQTLAQQQEERRKAKREDKVLGKFTGPVVERWQRMDKRQRLFVHLGVGLLVIGVICAIAVGITVAVNGTVYSGEDSSKQIPDVNQ